MDSDYSLLFRAMDCAHVGAWYWDLHANQHQWSALCCQYLALPEGRPPDIEHFYSVIHPDDRKRIECLVNDAIYQKT